MSKNKIMVVMTMMTIGVVSLVGCSPKKESFKPEESDIENTLNKKKTEADIADKKTETINGKEMTIFEFKDGSSMMTEGGDKSIDDINKAIEESQKNGGGEQKKIPVK